MIATHSFTNLFRNADRNALDLPVAALAGLSVAFAAFTIPADLLAEAVGASGLPNLLEAAQPPLGTTARIALAVAGALGTFFAAFLLLRWLDRFGARPAPRIAPAAESEAESPRLRKRDTHPDAPARRPISATRDLGEPAPPQPVASWLDVELEAPAPAPAAEAPASSSLTELMGRLEAGLARRATAAPAPEAAPQPAPSASDDRLQSAIESLQRLTARDA
ncbi:MAG: hypothetical protein ACT4N8_11405 [Sphingosinicella sp.]|uniref:hypothetical protein n=1 Tax=Sphingosinicella sp. TaxID=1917971 RepID=UPI0040380BB3